MLDIPALEKFIVAAKAASYVGGGSLLPPSRPSSRDMAYQEGPWRYLDSYYGESDFVGQEAVWKDDQPVWAMNYYGRILKPDSINASQAAMVIRQSLSKLYLEGRFLGGFEHYVEPYKYADSNEGTVKNFVGIERMTCEDAEIYRLDYHGGLIV